MPATLAPPVDDATERALAGLVEHQTQLAETAQAIAGGNLARDVQVASGEDTLGAAFRDMLAGLRRLVGQVKDAAADVDAGPKQPTRRFAPQTPASCRCATQSRGLIEAPATR